MDRQAIEEQLKRQGGTIKELSPITKFLFVICTAVLSILFGGPVYIAVISVVYIILSLFAHVFKGFFKSYFKLFVFFGLMLILISSLFQNAEAEVLLSIGKISLYKVGFILRLQNVFGNSLHCRRTFALYRDNAGSGPYGGSRQNGSVVQCCLYGSCIISLHKRIIGQNGADS